MTTSGYAQATGEQLDSADGSGSSERRRQDTGPCGGSPCCRNSEADFTCSASRCHERLNSDSACTEAGHGRKANRPTKVAGRVTRMRSGCAIAPANAVTQEVEECYRKGPSVGPERVRANLTTSGRKTSVQRKRTVRRGNWRPRIAKRP
jgi:hypothetical protein